MIVSADARRLPLADESVQCIVTSPPYFGLRKYAGQQELVWGGCEGCAHEWADESIENRDIRTGLGLAEWSKKNARGGGLKPAKIGRFTIHRGTCLRCGAWRGAYGLEPTVEMYVEHTVLILRELRRVLRKDGVLFWNIGDSYAGGNSRGGPEETASKKQLSNRGTAVWMGRTKPLGGIGLKRKDLCLVPARVALAAQADGWWVRSDIIWAKPNAMPESVTDRPTDAYEHILMLTKSARYFWDADAVCEKFETKAEENYPARSKIVERGVQGFSEARGGDRGQSGGFPTRNRNGRNLRNVWNFATQPYSGAHFATFPEELPRRCIKATTRQGDLVLDPFGGSGTTDRVAIELNRRAVLVDLAYGRATEADRDKGRDYAALAEERTSKVQRELGL
jgi:DNA modification methylase